MKTKAVRLYGKNDLRLEEFELPEMGEDEILAEVISDSVCMSSYKAVSMGTDHKRVPADIAVNPVIIGHEFCGRILKVGRKWQDEFEEGQKFSIQPAMNYKGTMDAPGYSFRFIGGDSRYVVIPHMVMETGSLLRYDGEAFFYGSLAEPVSCIVGAFHANYHVKQGTYVHHMGIVEGGRCAILAGVGPMGLCAVNYAVRGPRKPSLLVVTDIDEGRLQRAAKVYSPEWAAENGVELRYVNTGSLADPAAELRAMSGGGGFDDVFCMAPVAAVVGQADAILAKDGCLNFFAGPGRTDFSAPLNLFNVHYNGTHIVGTTGGNTEDLREALALMADGTLDPVAMITHVGGLNTVIDTVLNLPKIPGGKKLIYTHIDFPLVALDELSERGRTDPLCSELARLVEEHNGLWNAEAEKYLLAHADRI